MKTHSIAVYFVAIAAFFAAMIEEKAEASPVMISGAMPAYTGTSNDCGPLSVAMVLGYWDIKYGDTNLFAIKGGVVSSGTNPGTGLYLTSNVANEINLLAGPTYCNTNSTTGGTLPNTLAIGLVDYAIDNGGYMFQATSSHPFLTTIWNNLVADIGANKPPIFYVDNNGDGIADHFVPVIGYDSDYQGTGKQYYACYTTGSEGETPVWEKFQSLPSQGAPDPTYAGAVYGETRITSSVPEPSTLFMVIGGMGVLAFVQRSRRRSF